MARHGDPQGWLHDSWRQPIQHRKPAPNGRAAGGGRDPRRRLPRQRARTSGRSAAHHVRSCLRPRHSAVRRTPRSLRCSEVGGRAAERRRASACEQRSGQIGAHPRAPLDSPSCELAPTWSRPAPRQRPGASRPQTPGPAARHRRRCRCRCCCCCRPAPPPLLRPARCAARSAAAVAARPSPRARGRPPGGRRGACGRARGRARSSHRHIPHRRRRPASAPAPAGPTARRLPPPGAGTCPAWVRLMAAV